MSQIPPPPTIQYASHTGNPSASSGLALSSMICGIIGILFFPLAVVGLILGIIAIKKNRGKTGSSRGFAVAGIATSGVGLAIGACMISIMLPALNRAREAANQIRCASNLRQIALACKMYANENPGMVYPPNFAAMALTQDITAVVFNCPNTNDTPAGTGDPKLWASKISASNGTCSYIYIPGFTDNADANTVIAYEPLTNHAGDGSNFVFADGHVDWVVAKTAKQAIAELTASQNPPPSLK